MINGGRADGIHRSPSCPQRLDRVTWWVPPRRRLPGMQRPRPLPAPLADRPFRLLDAAELGVNGERLRTAEVRRAHRGVYVPRTLPDVFDIRCDAAFLALPERAVLSHRAAAAWYGCPLPDRSPVAVEVTVPAGTVLPQLQAVRAHAARLEADDVRSFRGRAVTSPARTVLDLAAELSLVDLVAVADSLLARGLVTREALEAMVDGAARRRGVRRARRALELVEPRTRSAMETRVRVLLILAGLPRPECNVDVFDAEGQWVATVDFLYRDQRIVIEYDGRHHGEEDQRVYDLARRNTLTRAGYVILHFSARDVLRWPERLVAEVREALDRAGKSAP
jgi:hypothetical protein